MDNTEVDFWSILHNSLPNKSADPQETLAYCRGTLAQAMDLIEEERFRETNRKLMGLNYYIDCVATTPELQEIYDTVGGLLYALDEPEDKDTNDTFGFTIALPYLQQPLED